MTPVIVVTIGIVIKVVVSHWMRHLPIATLNVAGCEIPFRYFQLDKGHGKFLRNFDISYHDGIHEW